MCDGRGMREYHSFNHILESNEMNEREGRKRLILRIHKRNDCFEREGGEIECVVWRRRMRSWGVI